MPALLLGQQAAYLYSITHACLLLHCFRLGEGGRRRAWAGPDTRGDWRRQYCSVPQLQTVQIDWGHPMTFLTLQNQTSLLAGLLGVMPRLPYAKLHMPA